MYSNHVHCSKVQGPKSSSYWCESTKCLYAPSWSVPKWECKGIIPTYFYIHCLLILSSFCILSSLSHSVRLSLSFVVLWLTPNVMCAYSSIPHGLLLIHNSICICISHIGVLGIFASNIPSSWMKLERETVRKTRFRARDLEWRSFKIFFFFFGVPLEH